MLVRPLAPRGLLLLAVPLTASSPSLALFLSHGRFIAQTEGPGPQLRVQSRQRARAGRWHTVRGEERGRGGGRPGAPRLTSPFPPPGVCALGEDAHPAGDGQSLGPEPGGAGPAAPGDGGPPALHSLCRGPPCQRPQPQAPSENHLPACCPCPAGRLPVPGDLTPTHPSAPTGRRQLRVQRLCEETQVGWAAPGGPHADGGGHALLLGPSAEGPLLRRQRGRHHSRCVQRWCPPVLPGLDRGGVGVNRAREGPGAEALRLHGPSLQTLWGPHCLTWAWSWRCGPRQPLASSSTWAGARCPPTCSCRCRRSR